MRIELLKGIETLEELKGLYRKLAMKYHPDKCGSCEKMQQLNSEYEYLSKTLKNSFGYTETEETAKDFINVINELIKYFDEKEEITIELKGSWFWIWGTNKDDKKTIEFLKGLCFRWNRKRSCWQHGEGRGRGNKDIEEINSKYGNKIIKKGKNALNPQLT